MAVPFNATGLWPSANFGDAPKYASGTRGSVSISATDRAALDDPKLEAASSDTAYIPREGAEQSSAASNATLAANQGASVVASGGAAVQKRE